ncbi:MAG: NAD(P)/FAD-dependent oxidoreductase [Pseudomonadota bacterium]
MTNAQQNSGAAEKADVAIIGGGLAGLTLALQLRQRRDDLHVVVLERRREAPPQSIHTVGESTVEIGAHYLGGVLGQAEHLREKHLSKFGLRLFFGASDGDLANADEVGASFPLETPTYQVDRGTLEAHLADEARRLGVEIRNGVRIGDVCLNGTRHRVGWRDGNEERALEPRWLIDTASRASPLKRHLNLAADNDHDGSAVWFRVAEKIRVDEWSSDADWLARTGNHKRWLSTNHLMGPGYWVWLIPLSTGATSVGIVADPALHAPAELRSYDHVLRWLDKHQPRLAGELRNCDLLDFHQLGRYSHGCKQVFSDDRWALSGESGVFLDPYYSPGTDFIAFSNSMLTDLVARERDGADMRLHSRLYQQMYFSFYRDTLQLYQGQYPGFGDSHLMALKTVWDFAYYWGILACLFFNGAMTDLDAMADVRNDVLLTQKNNRNLQRLFRERAAKRLTLPESGRFIDLAAMPLMVRLNAQLCTPVEGAELGTRIRENVAVLDDLARVVESLLVGNSTDAAVPSEAAMVADLRQRLA